MLRRLVRRSALERRIALQAAVFLSASRIALPVLPVRVVEGGLRLLGRFFPRSAPRSVDLGATVAWAVRAAARRLPGHTGCLPEALAAHQILLGHGEPSRLRIGVRPGERLAAHAWVESRGRVIVGQIDDLPAFHPLERGRDRRLNGLATLLSGGRVLWSDLATTEEVFQTEVAEQDLTGLVHRARASATNWPAGLIAAIADNARAQVTSEMIRARETRSVLDGLAAAGVRPLLFKGTALAYGVYPHPSLRPRNDTDVLIRESNRAAAEAALRAIGYQATNYCADLFRQFEMQRQDEYGLTHAFDIHWSVSTQAVFADLFAWDELAANSISVPSLGVNARAIGPVDALLWACVHPAMHHRNEERLIWVYDAHLLAGHLSQRDWKRFADLAVRKAVAAICADGLRRATSRFGTAVPPSVLDRLEEAASKREPSARYLEAGRRWGNELAANLAAVGWRERIRLLHEVVFPAPRYMLTAYGVSRTPLSSALLPALYVHRGARGAWRVLTGRK